MFLTFKDHLCKLKGIICMVFESGFPHKLDQFSIYLINSVLILTLNQYALTIASDGYIVYDGFTVACHKKLPMFRSGTSASTGAHTGFAQESKLRRQWTPAGTKHLLGGDSRGF
jgi:hypothetical protein